ncbi:MAG: DUF1801 domain-containing protein [Vicinamibacterales bacterium]
MPAGDFFADYPEQVARTCHALREVIQSALPAVQEEVDPAGRVVGYNCGPGYAGLICTIIPSKAGVKLGIVNGATLPNPDGLLEGAGKRHKYVRVMDALAARHPSVSALLQAAHSAWRARTGAGKR